MAHLLKTWREDRGLSLRQAQEPLGVHFTVIGAIERGRPPRVATARKLALILGCTLDEFYGKANGRRSKVSAQAKKGGKDGQRRS